MIALRQIRGRWGDFSLEVDFEVKEGSYLVFLGPSGSGKSLLLATIAGLERVDEGRVLLAGEDVSAAPPERRGLGFVFQRFSLFPHLSIADNIAFGLRARKVAKTEIRERVAEMVEILGIEDLLQRPATALSGGEAQKVAIARALAPRPRLLLLDEPLSLVDHNGRIQLQKELREVHDRLGLTTLHVTHDREEARALGDSCAVMLGGRIVQHASADEVFRQPFCSFVQHFLGLEGDSLPARKDCSALCLAGRGLCDRRQGDAS